MSKSKTLDVEIPSPLQERIHEVAQLMGCTEDEVIIGCLTSCFEMEASGKVESAQFLQLVREKLRGKK